MRNNEQMPPFELVVYGAEKFQVKLVQSCPRGIQQRMDELFDVFRIEPELRELLLQHAYNFRDAPNGRNVCSIYFILRDQRDQDAVLYAKIFNQRDVGSKAFPNRFKRHWPGFLQAGGINFI